MTAAFTLGERLAKARKDKKLDQEQLAAKTGLDRRQISAYETDRKSPRVENLTLICRALGIDVNVLLGLPKKRT